MATYTPQELLDKLILLFELTEFSGSNSAKNQKATLKWAQTDFSKLQHLLEAEKNAIRVEFSELTKPEDLEANPEMAPYTLLDRPFNKIRVYLDNVAMSLKDGTRLPERPYVDNVLYRDPLSGSWEIETSDDAINFLEIRAKITKHIDPSIGKHQKQLAVAAAFFIPMVLLSTSIHSQGDAISPWVAIPIYGLTLVLFLSAGMLVRFITFDQGEEHHAAAKVRQFYALQAKTVRKIRQNQLAQLDKAAEEYDGGFLDDLDFSPAYELSDKKFEQEVAFVLGKRLGLRPEVVGQPGDKGVDVKLYDLATGQLRAIVQAKRQSPSRPIPPGVIRALETSKNEKKVDKAYLVTTAYFSTGSRKLEDEFGIELIDGKQFEAWRKEVYNEQERGR